MFLLLLLLLLGISAVLWYVLDRRATMLAPTAAARIPVPADQVDLTKHDLQTIDFSSGRPVVMDSPEERAALAAAEKELAEVVRSVTFESPKKNPVPPKK